MLIVSFCALTTSEKLKFSCKYWTYHRAATGCLKHTTVGHRRAAAQMCVYVHGFPRIMQKLNPATKGRTAFWWKGLCCLCHKIMQSPPLILPYPLHTVQILLSERHKCSSNIFIYLSVSTCSLGRFTQSYWMIMNQCKKTHGRVHKQHEPVKGLKFKLHWQIEGWYPRLLTTWSCNTN